MFDDQTHVLKVPNARFGMAEPETFRVIPDHSGSSLNQLRWRGSGRFQFVQFIACNGHIRNLRNGGGESKTWLCTWLLYPILVFIWTWGWSLAGRLGELGIPAEAAGFPPWKWTLGFFITAGFLKKFPSPDAGSGTWSSECPSGSCSASWNHMIPFRNLTRSQSLWTRLAYTACYAVIMWALALGFLGVFIRFCANQSPWRRYVTDASYWIYIVHLPLVVALQVALSADSRPHQVPAHLRGSHTAALHELSPFATGHIHRRPTQRAAVSAPMPWQMQPLHGGIQAHQ